MKVEGRGVQSIEVGGRILTALIELGQPTMLRDLAARAGMTSAQAHAYLVSYRKLGLVEQNPANGHYFLGPLALQLGLVRMRGSDPLRMASDTSIELSEATGYMVTVTVWGTHGPTIIQVHEAAYPVHVNLRAGALYTLTGTATGRLFAAIYPFEVVRTLLAREMRAEQKAQHLPSGKSREAFTEDFDEIRRLGYATTEGVPVPGINAVSVPVFDQSQKMQFALTAIGPTSALDVRTGSRDVAGVAEAINRLSEKLGYRPDLAANPAPAKPRMRPRRG
ncbi:IclR family transcriptional regulator [Bradyrhizobium prioriisuperbiae]|uniref:IclR family transcriptional regulator n=1 Tax=Bradyrhizobium prioriisuperbiae TaxID=2854389 RepID=UPI0028E58C45|nr:IclR family transcriptional regulator [Bradyrhizobium prioritasuperba]